MANFEFYSVGRIVFGRGRFGEAGRLAAELGRRALVVTNSRDESGLPGRLETLLQEQGVSGLLFRQKGEPTVADANRGAAAARENKCDMVIGVGGGSALDAAKAVAALMTNGGSALDYMEVVGKGLKIQRPAAPWIAIPCTAGTGSEATRNTVIGCPEKRFKASIRSEWLLPTVALVDPELTLAVRPEVTARAGMDALCQLIESYTSKNAGPLTDVLALEGLRRAGRSLARAYDNGRDIDAREDMSLAALLSGITLTNAGLGAVHAYAAPLGATTAAPHGTICAALLPGVMAANVAALQQASGGAAALQRYADIGRTLTGRFDRPSPAAVTDSIDFVRNLKAHLNIPGLGQFGLTEAMIPDAVALARKANSMKYNPVELTDETLGQILRESL